MDSVKPGLSLVLKYMENKTIKHLPGIWAAMENLRIIDWAGWKKDKESLDFYGKEKGNKSIGTPISKKEYRRRMKLSACEPLK